MGELIKDVNAKLLIIIIAIIAHFTIKYDYELTITLVSLAILTIVKINILVLICKFLALIKKSSFSLMNI